LLTVDTTRIETALHYLTFIAIGPIQIVVVVAIILSEIGITFLSGLFLLLAIFMPIKAILARIYNKFRVKNCRVSDERISILSEILGSIKIIKMYCWETPFTDKATKARKFL
jgi:hypothetical protein